MAASSSQSNLHTQDNKHRFATSPSMAEPSCCSLLCRRGLHESIPDLRTCVATTDAVRHKSCGIGRALADIFEHIWTNTTNYMHIRTHEKHDVQSCYFAAQTKVLRDHHHVNDVLRSSSLHSTLKIQHTILETINYGLKFDKFDLFVCKWVVVVVVVVAKGDQSTFLWRATPTPLRYLDSASAYIIIHQCVPWMCVVYGGSWHVRFE